VELINDIASRVNVLGLNAAIEATNAGEYGKGFVLVADEIRKLAKNAKTATGEIIQLVGTVKKGISDVMKVMKDGLDNVKESSNLTDTALHSLREIKQLIEIDQKRITNIDFSISKMKNFSDQVGEAMENVASVGVKNSSGMENVNVSTKEMSVQLESVSSLARSLENMSKAEDELLAKFNLWNTQ
jgi:methyl-accepting chemotaxis protein